MANIKNIESVDELNEILSNNEKVALKFTADWCGPCRMMSNSISLINEDDVNGFKFFEINVDAQFASTLCSYFKIQSIPLMVYFKDGNVVTRTVGAQTTNTIIELINEL